MKFIGNVLAGLSSVFYFVILLLMTGLLVLSNAFSADYYTEIFESIDIKEIKLSDLGVTGSEGDMTIEAALVDALGEAGISESDAKRIVNNEKINEVAGELISDTMTYIVEQENIPELKVEDVKEILESEDMSVIVDDMPSDMNAEEITEELNKMIHEALEGVNYDEY